VKSRTKDLEAEVAKRKLNEEALRESEERYRSLLDKASDGIFILSSDGKLIDVNESFARMHGYSREELLRMNIRDLDTTKAVHLIPERMRQLLAGEILAFEVEHKHKDGHVFPLEVSANLVSIGGESCIQSFHRDITERKRAEEVLREREEQFATILRTATEGFWVTDRQGQFLEVNDAVCRNLGYRREELLRMSVSDIEAVEKPEEILQTVRRIMEKGSDQFEGLHRCKDGSLRNVEINVNYLPPPHDRFFAFLHDITERKRAEEERRKLERQLQTAQKMESVGTLAGGIAHDFNNVLTVIIGFGEMLKLRIAKDPKAVSDLDEILRGAERASVLTRQILTFARRQIIELDNLDLNRVVTDLEKLLRKSTREDIGIRTLLAEGVPTIRADQGQVEQVLMNLALNARDAMPGGGQLVVETQEAWLDEQYVKQYPYMKAGRYAVLSVTDTGIGMDEGTRERIFEPFFTTKGQDKGTGLGLAVVYGVVKQHNGFIHVYSEPGKGTTFRIYFPAVDVPPDSKVAAAREIIHGGNETILLAEDNESVRHLAEQTLIHYGYRVLTACDGEEAADIFLRHHKEIAIAVLDVVMPKMGGKQAYGGMITMAPGLKVLFISGYSANAIHDSFVVHQGLPFLQKPFGPSDLARMVREVLDGEGC
jgi:two-component system, cell cycle sensor histidine kinase and response regulator CckA